ncbi:hypothetical protein T03_15179 [Trichinella britovi]|uniref:Uncharacterized protein n=2 Tax=Trichinella TaxID=6333 RepID=A0A0V1CXF6_TRIBR|nr:hypothetical protein T12_15793 [Trichinella patagoniensis]KRY53839.1 hypothetical protein T03_15179 [Trichinella britovi]
MRKRLTEMVTKISASVKRDNKLVNGDVPNKKSAFHYLLPELVGYERKNKSLSIVY